VKPRVRRQLVVGSVAALGARMKSAIVLLPLGVGMSSLVGCGEETPSCTFEQRWHTVDEATSIPWTGGCHPEPKSTKL
jgi:hypothetical protein